MASFTVWPLRLTLALAAVANAGPACSGEGCDASAATGASLLAVKAETRASAGSLAELSEIPIDMTEGANVTTPNGTNGTNGSNSTLENVILKNLEHDLKEAKSIPDLENATNDTQGRHGFGQLGANLEFVMLKLAQLETVVELQQIEIHAQQAEIDKLKAWKGHVNGENTSEAQVGAGAPSATAAQKAKAAERAQKAQEVLKQVLHKHNHQREKRAFVTPQWARPAPAEAQTASASLKKAQKKEAEIRLLQQRAAAKAKAKKASANSTKTLDDTVSSKGIPIVDDVIDVVEDGVDVVTDGTGMIGDALGDAYESAADQISFVADTVIDSVEMAVDILVRGFTDWNAGCDENRWPSMSVDSSGLSVDWGRQKCWVRLMGQTCTLFDFNFGTTDLSWPEPLKTVASFLGGPIKAIFNMGKELVSCPSLSSPIEVIKCFGLKLIEYVPPLSTLNRMSDMLTQFIEVFAKVAASVVKQVLEDGQSLVQQASQSKFPNAGAPAVVHHAGKNLVIKTHSQHPQKRVPRGRTKLSRHEMSALQAQGDDDEGGGASGSINFAVHDQEGNYATKLITQFNGKETDTSSCLAFAPKNKHGSNNQATKADWQVSNEDDFIQLEPWAVPCDNSWMKDHWNQWQGYSFYTWEMSIEKCVTVTYALSMQPVLAFVGGMEFDLMPAPLAELDTVVCWPDKQPGGVDLSVLRSEIKSGGVLLFSRTLRLTQRFSGNTDFVDGNTFGAHETWRNPIGVATGHHAVEDDRTLEPMDRTSSMLQANSSEAKSETSAKRKPKQDEATFVWEETDLYMASADYGTELNLSRTGELRGPAATERLKRSMQGKRQPLSTLETNSSTDYFQLFRFKNPGMVSFEVLGLLEDNWLELGMKVNFGPFSSPERRIPLINIADQFSLVLAAMPFVSADSKLKAIASLKDFTLNDVRSVEQQAPPPLLSPGMTVAIHGSHFRRFLRMESGDMTSSSPRDATRPPDGSDDGTERFLVVDGGNGQIALHNPKWNRFVKMEDGEMTVSSVSAANALHSGWSYERFTAVYAGQGEIALHCSYWNRFLRIGDGHVDSSGVMNPQDLPDNWAWERLSVVQVAPYLRPGSVVALHSTHWNRFMRMNGEDMDHSGVKAANELPSDWTWEKFTVVYAGIGQVAFHSAKWNRYIKLSDGDAMASSVKGVNELPGGWTWERFTVVPGGNGEIALHNALHNRFLRMTNTGADASGVKNPEDLPGGWTWERFRVVEVSPPPAASQSWSFQA